MSNSQRRNVNIPSHGEKLGAWIYPAKGAKSGNNNKPPAILVAHGLGGVKYMGLDRFAEKFSEAGYVVVVFDYRHFGESTGEPRGLLDIELQIQDWNAALHYLLNEMKDEIDVNKIGLFGTSFSGGHVIRLAAENGEKIKATISQCPFTDGISSAMQIPFRQLPYLTYLGLRDIITRSKTDPVRVALIGKPDEIALLNSPDSVPGYQALLPQGQEKLEVEAVPARAALWIPLYRPGTYAKKVKSPIYFAVCKKDSVAPASATLRHAKSAPKGTIKEYDYGHFEIYVGEPFEQATRDYVRFYNENLRQSKL